MRRETYVPELTPALLVNVTAVVIAGTSLGVMLRMFHGNVVCDESASNVLFVLLPAAFSLALVWLAAETFRAFSPWLTSRLWAARLVGVVLALGLHFTVGTIGWALFPDAADPGQPDAADGIAVWIPLWLIGVLFKVGYVSLCQ